MQPTKLGPSYSLAIVTWYCSAYYRGSSCVPANNMFRLFRLFLLTVASVAARALDVDDLESKQILPLSKRTFTALVWSLRWGLPLCALSDFNSILNTWAENRWTWRNDKSAWQWHREVAVVTGGSAGIGSCVVKELVAHGIKVAILDIGPLSESFTKGLQSVD